MYTALVAVLCTVATHTVGAQVINVFVSIAPQKQFVEKIGGERVSVRVMLPPGQAPETFAPSPAMLVALSDAKLYFQIGVPFEQRWTHAIRSANPDIHIVECCERYLEGHTLPVDQYDHDMHLWSSPIWVMRLAGSIRDELVHSDPGNRSRYENNYRRFIAELQQLDQAILKELASRRTDYFIVSHAAWSFFAEQYDLHQIALEKNGKESGPRALAGIIHLAQQEKIDTVFVQEQYHSPYVDSLARELNAKIIELDPMREDYLANMYTVAGRIAGAVR